MEGNKTLSFPREELWYQHLIIHEISNVYKFYTEKSKYINFRCTGWATHNMKIFVYWFIQEIPF